MVGNPRRDEWSALSNEEQAALRRAKIKHDYRPGQYIFYQGNACLGLYYVEDGIVSIRKQDNDGNSMILRMAHSGESLGYRTFFANQQYAASAVALSPATVSFVAREAVIELLARNVQLGLNFLRRLAEDLQQAEDMRLKSATLQVRARLADILLQLKERFGSVDDQGRMTISLPLSRQDLAAMIGTRPETIARTVRALETDNVAVFRGREVVVNDLDALFDELEAVS